MVPVSLPSQSRSAAWKKAHILLPRTPHGACCRDLRLVVKVILFVAPIISFSQINIDPSHTSKPHPAIFVPADKHANGYTFSNSKNQRLVAGVQTKKKRQSGSGINSNKTIHYTFNHIRRDSESQALHIVASRLCYNNAKA